MPTRADVIVIGGGQAGLATSRELGLAGIDHVVLERDRIGASWAGLWDNFRLNTPNWSVRLPGLPYGGPDPDAFASRAEMVAHLERYRAEMDAPVLEGVEVHALEPRGEGFDLSTSDGPMSARSVVVCTGAYQRALAPPGTDGLPAHVTMLDTRAYRNPTMVPDGVVLVVGSGQSGCQIAEDLVDAGRSVILSCGRAPWVPRRIGDHDVFWWALETGFMSGRVETLPSPAARLAAQLTASGVDGGHDLHPRALQAKGVTLAGRFAGAENGQLRFLDDLAESIEWGDARTATSPGWLRGSAPNTASKPRTCPSRHRSRRVRRRPSTHGRSAPSSSREASAPTIPGSRWKLGSIRWGSRRRSTEPAPPSPDCSSWASISSVRASHRCSAGWAKTPRSWRGRSPGIWPRAARAHRDRTVQDPRPSTSASPPK